jgi:cytochrome c biogenesis protein CcmG, thiol:disulfide interchange protein DsbE
VRVEDDESNAPTPGAARRGRSRPDRLFIVITVIAGACLIGFVSFVVLRGPSHRSGGGTAALEAPPPTVLPPGTTAPEFTLPALEGDGPVSLSAFRGGPVLLNFFASWCPHCRQELGAVAAVARMEAGKVAVVGVDSNESSDTTARQLLAAAHASFPVALDPDAKVATRYQVVALPVSYFLNADGKVVSAKLGAQTVSSLTRWMARAEAGQ